MLELLILKSYSGYLFNIMNDYENNGFSFSPNFHFFRPVISSWYAGKRREAAFSSKQMKRLDKGKLKHGVAKNKFMIFNPSFKRQSNGLKHKLLRILKTKKMSFKVKVLRLFRF